MCSVSRVFRRASRRTERSFTLEDVHRVGYRKVPAVVMADG